MKKLALLSLVAVSMVGCSSVDTASTTDAIERAAKTVCPTLKAAVVALSTPNVLDERQQKIVETAQPIITAACAAGSEINADSLETLKSGAIQVISGVVASSSLTEQEKTRITVGLVFASTLIDEVVSK